LCAFDASDPVSGQSLLMRALNPTNPHRTAPCDPASSCRHGYPPMRSTRSPKNGAPLPSVAWPVRLSERWAQIALGASGEKMAGEAQPLSDTRDRAAA
jgi:hypothetical protein